MKFVLTQSMTLWEAAHVLAPDSSNSALRQWIRDGRILVDGRPRRKGTEALQPGQTLELARRIKKIPGQITIVYEDQHLVVIDKPCGLLSVSTDVETQQTAHALLKEYYNKPVYVVHRLDQDTSGVMVFAFSEKALEKLKTKFAAHDITRCYHAIVEGEMKTRRGTWDNLLHEDDSYYVHVTTDSSVGQRAISHFQVDKVKNGYTWLTVKLETGKKNQIRVQAKAAGFPVAGDQKYGGQTDPLRRLCLNAYLLEFKHPITNKPMKFVSSYQLDA